MKRSHNQGQLILMPPDQGVMALAETFLEPGSRILDAGCGRGQNAFHLAELGHEVLGIDSDPEMIETSRSLAQAFGSAAMKLSFEQTNLAELGVKPANFDAVLLTRVIHELRDRRLIRQALMRAQQATVNGGFNFVSAYIGSVSDRRRLPHLMILKPGEIGQMYRQYGWLVRYDQRQNVPVREFADGPRINSRDEIVVQKPYDPLQEKTKPPIKSQLPLEYLQRVDPELHEQG